MNQSVALATQNSSTIVVVDMIKRAAGMNARRPSGRGATLMPEIEIRTSSGEPRFVRFKDTAGRPFSPTLPWPIDTSTAHGKEQLEIIKAYKFFYDDDIQIIDPIANARQEINDDDLMLDAMNRLKALRKAGDTETLNNLLRRLEGPIGAKTEEVVISSLLRIAKSNPASILDLDQDPAFQQKVLIDKAKEAGRLVQRDRYFYYPDDFNGGRLIAEGVDKLLIEMRENEDLATFIDQAAKGLGQMPVTTTPGTKATLTAEQLAQLKAFDSLGQDKKEDEPADTGFVDTDILTEEKIRAFVQQAIAINYLESDASGNVKCLDTKFRSPADAEVFYVANLRAAQVLKEEMDQLGV